MGTDQSEIATGQSTQQQQDDVARNSAECKAYLEDEDRIAKIGAIMVRAFGIRSRVLSDQQYSEILPGWLAAFRTVATCHLDKLSTDGLARRCWMPEHFIAVYEAGMEAEAREREYEWQKKAQEAKVTAAGKPRSKTKVDKMIEDFWKG